MALILQNLTIKRAHKTLVYQLSIPQGECTAILGPEGTGKSTLLHLIAGFEQAHGGNIQLNNCDLQPLTPSQRPLSFIFQSHNLFDHLTVFENVALGIRGTLSLNAEDREAVQSALDLVGLSAPMHRYPAHLSLYETQCASLARAFLQDRPLLLIDDPFHDLTISEKQSLARIIREMQTHLGWSILWGTQTLSGIERLPNQVFSIQRTPRADPLPVYQLVRLSGTLPDDLHPRGYRGYPYAMKRDSSSDQPRGGYHRS